MAGSSGSTRVLAAIREGWLAGALPELVGDRGVAGLALVGSLGRGDGDDWSDVDLLVAVHDPKVAEFADRSRNLRWAGADLLVDARQNAPAGARSVSTLYVRSGLPLGVDWYVYPASRAAWPADGRVLHDPAGLPRVGEPFAAFNARGPRQPGTAKTPDEVRLGTLAMVPIAGKHVARRSPAAAGMIESGGGPAGLAGAAPAEQLRALRAVAARLSDGAHPQVEAAVAAYLGLIEATSVPSPNFR